MNHLYEATSATLLSRLHDPADHVAWDAFVKRYEPSVRSYCKRKFLSDSLTDEVVSEVLMTLGRHMPSFEYDEGRSFRTWLKTVIHSKLTDVIRREARRQEQAQGGTIMHMQLAEVSDRHKLDGVADELSEELTSVIDRDRLALQQLIEQIKVRAPKSWEAFELRKLKGLDGATVAKQLDMTVAAVHVAVSRTLKMLQKEAANLNG